MENGTVNICFVWYSFIDPFDSCIPTEYLSLDAANWCHHKQCVFVCVFFSFVAKNPDVLIHRNSYSEKKHHEKELKETVCLHMWKQHFHLDLPCKSIDSVWKKGAKMRQNKCLALYLRRKLCVSEAICKCENWTIFCSLKFNSCIFLFWFSFSLVCFLFVE